MLNQLDHVIIAAPNLDQAKEYFEELTGFTPLDGGSHPGLATRNALVSFGEGRYLEIVAPDPQQDIKGSFAEPLTLLDAPIIYHWVVNVDAIKEVRDRYIERGTKVGELKSVSRESTAGDMLSWKMFCFTDHNHGGLLPLYIDWEDCPHPSASVPIIGNLLGFELVLPQEHSEVKILLNPAPDGVRTKLGKFGVRLRFESPKGDVELSSNTKLMGFQL